MNIGDVALAYWRLEKWVAEINVERKTAATSSLRQMKRYLDENGIELKDYLGQKYDSGFAIDVIGRTTDKDLLEDQLVVSETLVPLILENGEILKYGQVMLGEEVKTVASNNELPPDPEKAIEILNHNISQYMVAPYKDKKIVYKLRWVREKLEKQLRNIRRGK
jgi:hypothetical protein